MNEHEETPLSACHCCGYETTLTRYCIRDSSTINEYWLCRLCAGSHASAAMRYGTEGASLHQTMCYVGNAVIDALRKAQP